MDVLLGFDPGGARQFGWAVLNFSVTGALEVRATGVGSHAAQAVDAALTQVRRGESVRAAGIDSPLYWTPSGERAADVYVREVVRRRGAGSSAGGTVQHPNCLQGACVIQGPTAALLLRDRLHELPLTESHPKALLWALGMASAARRPAEVSRVDVATIVRGTVGSTEHERDAVLGGYAAWGMVSQAPGWRDLVLDEKYPLFFTSTPVSYWFPCVAT
jgi:hypothetical protein